LRNGRSRCGGQADAANPTRAARVALADNEAELEAAVIAKGKLAERAGDLEDEHRDASNRVTVAVDAVLRAGAADVLAQAEEAALKLRALLPALQFMVAPEFGPEMVGRPLRPLFDTDWDHERRTLGPERADRRHFAGDARRRDRDEPFTEMQAAIRRFIERPPQNDSAHRHPSLAAWQEARAALMDDADAPLPPI
jgi:hypothetical protein